MSEPIQEIPQISRYSSFGAFLSESTKLFKRLMSTSEVQRNLREMGLGSRITFKQVVSGRRRYAESRVSTLGRVLDLSFKEMEHLKTLVKGDTVEVVPTPTFVLGDARVLSSPIQTIILNLCGLEKKPTKNELLQALSFFYEQVEAETAIAELIGSGHLKPIEGDRLERIVVEGGKLSTPNGLKVDFVKGFTHASLDLAKKAFELDCGRREYTAFTAKIREADFGKVKDLIRNFRKDIYALESQDSDCVVHLNANAFVVGNVTTEET